MMSDELQLCNPAFMLSSAN